MFIYILLPTAIPVPLPEEFADLLAGREDVTDNDEVVQAILRAREKHREHPPAIEIEDGVSSLSLHPKQNIIAVGIFTGDVAIYEFSNEACEVKNTHELHMEAIRDVQFSIDGDYLVTASKDQSILVTDVETGKLRNAWDKAHSSPVSTLLILGRNMFCSGCDEGYVKMWDTRRKEPIFSEQVMEDAVSAMATTSQKKVVAVACGGVITAINVNQRKLLVQSEDYEHDITCLAAVRQDTKLIAGSSKGTMYSFKWGQFGVHTEELAGNKVPVSCVVPVAENCIVTGSDDGKIRANYLYPHQALGVVGQHSYSVDCLDINSDGALIASAATGGQVKFWNVKYLEEMEVFVRKQMKVKEEHNLPSSNVQNVKDFFAGMAS